MRDNNENRMRWWEGGGRVRVNVKEYRGDKKNKNKNI